MNVASQIGVLVLQTLATLFLIMVLLRFMLQLARADFYNPVSQSIVRFTNPLLKPLRKVIPGLGGLDLASLVLALLVGFVLVEGKTLMVLGKAVPVLQALIWSAIGVLSTMAKIYFWALIVSIIASWIAPGSRNPVLELLSQLLRPIMAPVHKLIPPMGGLDISPIFVLLGLGVVDILIRALAQGAHMRAGYFLGL
ncbi:YggT family protein [Biformimicrobium ophioploci]|uniref:YggT family protein n=1 Tax=Biformimicrobium ophioploci TaxID=3036711 RepID=A0ABQ6LV84_9GAMM|nr:YggT family protein [Microbulbifer sp. NKW57]GMG85932.1 YggT family protein [Microbulbifer sp. NKW57]